MLTMVIIWICIMYLILFFNYKIGKLNEKYDKIIEKEFKNE